MLAVTSYRRTRTREGTYIFNVVAVTYEIFDDTGKLKLKLSNEAVISRSFSQIGEKNRKTLVSLPFGVGRYHLSTNV